MPTTDKRVDAYIAKSADFAKPILTELRAIVHEGCPDVEETIKWRMPTFMYKGMLCGMAAFKQHCAMGFWKGRLIVDPKQNKSLEAMGQFGKITSVKDLPPKRVLLGYVRQAVELNEQGVKSPTRSKPSTERKEVIVPDYFAAALKKNKKAQAAFDGFSYSHRKEYVEWITDAKADETRQRRIATALQWLAEGKSRNWKYVKC